MLTQVSVAFPSRLDNQLGLDLAINSGGQCRVVVSTVYLKSRLGVIEMPTYPDRIAASCLGTTALWNVHVLA